MPPVFPDGSVVQKMPTNTGDVGSKRGAGRSLGEENGNPLQYSCLGNPMDRGAWQATLHGVAKELDVTEQQNSDNTVNQLCAMLSRSVMSNSVTSWTVAHQAALSMEILQARILE